MVDRRHLLLGVGTVVLAGAGAVWSGARRMGTMEEYSAAMTALRVPLPASPVARDLIRFATLAANSHNTQPWTFRAAGTTVDILPDLARATPVVDPDNHHLFISLGCAAENLSIAAASRGMPGEVRFDPGTGEIRFAHGVGAATDTPLSDAIPLRQSTRGIYDGSTLSPAELADLESAARVPGVDLILITERAMMNKVTDLMAAANTAQIRARAKAKVASISILRERGHLAGSINYEATEDGVRIGSAVRYSAIHQLGGTIQKQAGSRWMEGRRFAKREKAPNGKEVAIRAHQIKIPSRPYLGVSAEDQVSIAEMADDWLVR